MIENQGGFIEPENRMPQPKPEADPRLVEVASLQAVVKESEGDYTFVGYASNPRGSNPHWVIHVMEGDTVLVDRKVPRLDMEAPYSPMGAFSHNDMRVLENAIGLLKRIFNPSIDANPSL